MALLLSIFSSNLRLVLAVHLSKFFIVMALQVVALCVSDEFTMAKLHFAGTILTYWGYIGGNFAYQVIYFSVFQGTNLMQRMHRRLHWASTVSYLFWSVTATASAAYHDLVEHYYVIDLSNPVDVYFFIALCVSAGAGTVCLTYSLVHMYKTLARERAEGLSNPPLSTDAVGRTPPAHLAVSTDVLRQPSAANPDDPENGGRAGKPDKTSKAKRISLSVKLWVITSNVNAAFGCAAVLVCHPAVLFAASATAACYYILIKRALLAIAAEGSQLFAKGHASAAAQPSSTKAAAVARSSR